MSSLELLRAAYSNRFDDDPLYGSDGGEDDDNPFWNEVDTAQAVEPAPQEPQQLSNSTPERLDISGRIQALLRELMRTGATTITQSQLDAILTSGQPPHTAQTTLKHGRAYLLQASILPTRRSTCLILPALSHLVFRICFYLLRHPTCWQTSHASLAAVAARACEPAISF